MGVESLVGLRPLLEDSILVRLHRRNRARHRAARLHCGQADLIHEHTATEADPPGVVSSRLCSIGGDQTSTTGAVPKMSGVSNSAQMPTPPRRGSKSRCCISATVREAPSDIAKSPLAARVAPIPAERALAGFRRALGPPSRFESPGTTAVALAPPRPADGRESNSAGSRRLGTEAPSG